MILRQSEVVPLKLFYRGYPDRDKQKSVGSPGSADGCAAAAEGHRFSDSTDPLPFSAQVGPSANRKVAMLQSRESLLHTFNLPYHTCQ